MPRRSLLTILLLLSMAALHAQTPVPAPENADPSHLTWTGMDRPLNISSFWFTNSTQDDPAFAQPGYDDSHWRPHKRGETLRAYWQRPSSVVWYRTHIEVPPGAGDLTVSIRSIHGPFELYANGQKVGGAGSMGGQGVFGDMIPLVYHLPANIAPDGHLVLALRAGILVTNNSAQGGIGTDSYLLLGSAAHSNDTRSLAVFESLASNYTNSVIACIAGIVAIGLFLSARGREYLDLAISYITLAVYNIVEIWEFSRPISRSGFALLLTTLLATIPVLFNLEFIRRILGRPRWKLFGVTQVLMLVNSVALQNLFVFAPQTFSFLVQGLFPTAFAIATYALLDFVVPIIIFRAWRGGNRDAGLLLVAVLPSSVLVLAQITRSILILAKAIAGGNNPLERVPGITFDIGWSEVTSFFASIVLLLFMVLRTIRLAREKAELSAEIAAAHNVQTLLLARAAQPTPGFAVETAYRPASEVGGDFFLISPGQDGSLFAIVGDVSGKGMQAALRVSLILGALHRESSREPSIVLQNLNSALLSQGDIGFTTACALLVEKDGRFRYANAGHLNPYLDGEELPSAGALPLGISPQAEYDTEHGNLATRQRLVLLSDGVPEARSAAGDLYGFDKLVTLTRLPANDIAEVAHAFGQTDDITVLALALA
ncbi:SpoIIE family protein phosphatase [Terriglobus albidus]|uniref:SpoIIE family protein phosphatase n=1 Tax=Terriglobus albidus TaxID=1592106 RepID=A0A5B9EG76_9BACT|nr:SpoIIE family protein phosphatase [Terriglobus albidus]QEE31032.1 SpoIIE family protein phosphatase [Terriglobus albidus]